MGRRSCLITPGHVTEPLRGDYDPDVPVYGFAMPAGRIIAGLGRWELHVIDGEADLTSSWWGPDWLAELVADRRARRHEKAHPRPPRHTVRGDHPRPRPRRHRRRPGRARGGRRRRPPRPRPVMITGILSLLLVVLFFTMLSSAWNWLAKVGWATAADMIALGWWGGVWAQSIVAGRWLSAAPAMIFAGLAHLWWQISGHETLYGWLRKVTRRRGAPPHRGGGAGTHSRL
jgi:hypothetical protein